MDDDIFIVAQGQSNFSFTPEVIEYYKNTKNFIWSTWIEDCPNDYFSLFKPIGYVTVHPRPSTLGRAHLNFQCKSVINGINIAKGWGGKYIFKTRTDLLIPDIEKVAQQMKDDLIKSGKLFGHMLFDSWHHQGGDLISFGTIEESEIFWGLDPEVTIDGFAEKILITEYLRKKGINDYQMNADDMGKYFYWCFGAFEKLGISIKWLKYPDRSPLEWYLRKEKGYIY